MPDLYSALSLCSCSRVALASLCVESKTVEEPFLNTGAFQQQLKAALISNVSWFVQSKMENNIKNIYLYYRNIGIYTVHTYILCKNWLMYVNREEIYSTKSFITKCKLGKRCLSVKVWGNVSHITGAERRCRNVPVQRLTMLPAILRQYLRQLLNSSYHMQCLLLWYLCVDASGPTWAMRAPVDKSKQTYYPDMWALARFRCDYFKHVCSEIHQELHAAFDPAYMTEQLFITGGQTVPEPVLYLQYGR